MNAKLNNFKKALLEAVLEEHGELDPEYRDQNSIWIDGVNGYIYRRQHPGCIQHLFLSRERMEARIKLLLEQGYILK